MSALVIAFPSRTSDPDLPPGGGTAQLPDDEPELVAA